MILITTSIKRFSLTLLFVLLTIPLISNTIIAQETNTYKIGFIFDLLPENATILLDLARKIFE